MPNLFFKAQCACELGPLPVSCARARQYQTPAAVFIVIVADEFLWSLWKQDGATVVRTRSKGPKQQRVHPIDAEPLLLVTRMAAARCLRPEHKPLKAALVKAMRNLTPQLWVGSRCLFPDWAREDLPARCQLYALPLPGFVSRI